MDELTQTISNLVGILLGIVGAVGVGFFIYGAYLYLTASGAPQERNDDGPGGHRPGDGGLRRRGAGDERRGGFPGGPQRARPQQQRRRRDVRQLGERKEKSHERTRGSNPRAGRGQGPAVVHLPAGRGDDGGVRPVLRRIPLRPRRAVRGEDGGRRPPGGPCRRPRAVAGRDRLRGDGAGRRAAALRRGTHRLRRPGRRHAQSGHHP